MEDKHTEVSPRRLSRRKALRVLGMGLGSAAVLAACGEEARFAATNTVPTATPNILPTATSTAAPAAPTTVAATTAPVATPTSRATTKIVLSTAKDPTGTVIKIIEEYNKLNTGVTIEYLEQEQDSSVNKAFYAKTLGNKESNVDVLAADIPWMPEFSQAGWVAPLDKFVTTEIRDQFFEGTLQGATYKNGLYGLPWYINAGALYYRKDLLTAANVKVPNTFADLEKAAAQLQKPDQNLWGYVHGGFQNEGLAANWLEVLWGFGGNFWDAKSGEIQVDKSDAAEKSLQWWVDNIYTRKITAPQVPTWKTPDVHKTFLDGNAVFMRSWADFYALSQAADSKVAGKVGIKAILTTGSGKAPSCLGNWYLAVSAFSKNQAAAWEVVKYMTSPEGSRLRTLGTGAPPGNRLTYRNEGVLNKYPHFGNFGELLDGARPRPVTPAYNQISAEVIQVEVANVLARKTTPKEAVKIMAEKSRSIMTKF